MTEKKKFSLFFENLTPDDFGPCPPSQGSEQPRFRFSRFFATGRITTSPCSDRWINQDQTSGQQLFFRMPLRPPWPPWPPPLPPSWHHSSHWLVAWPWPRQPFLAIITLSLPKAQTSKFANANNLVAGGWPQAFRCNFYTDLMPLLI